MDTLKHTDTIDTKTQEDTRTPLVQSVLILSEDNTKIVVSDHSNKCVKCLCLKRKSVIKKHVTSSAPWGLVESHDHQAVVTVLSREKKLLFLNWKDFELIKTVTTNKVYFYIAVLPRNRLAVTGGRGQYLDILTDSGELINSISGNLIYGPWFLTVHDESLIVVSEFKNSLVCVTSSGDVNWMSFVSDSFEGEFRGIACDRDGDIFVCDIDNHRVVQLSQKGKFIRHILTRQDGLSAPWSICCHENMLCVAQYSGEIKIFSWSKAKVLPERVHL